MKTAIKGYKNTRKNVVIKKLRSFFRLYIGKTLNSERKKKEGKKN